MFDSLVFVRPALADSFPWVAVSKAGKTITRTNSGYTCKPMRKQINLQEFPSSSQAASSKVNLQMADLLGTREKSFCGFVPLNSMNNAIVTTSIFRLIFFNQRKQRNNPHGATVRHSVYNNWEGSQRVEEGGLLINEQPGAPFNWLLLFSFRSRSLSLSHKGQQAQACHCSLVSHEKRNHLLSFHVTSLKTFFSKSFQTLFFNLIISHKKIARAWDVLAVT